MKSIIFWIKQHKFVSVLLVVIGVFLLRDSSIFNSYSSRNMMYDSDFAGMPTSGRTVGNMVGDTFGISPKVMMNESVSLTQTDRMVVQNSYLSLVVDNVEMSAKKIITNTQSLGGFMVSSSVNNPASGGTANVEVRIPVEKLETALEAFRGLAVKVVTENLEGQDITDQFTDVKARMATLQKTKLKFEEILDKATAVQDILEVQRELISIQSQIDSLQGQETYMLNTSKTAKLSIYLSTDELSLPYSPRESWRPQVVLKEAVRSLQLTVRAVANLVIWLLVYAVVWIPVLGIIFFIRRKNRAKMKV
ncbi:MAG: DUF4349 domain-containing protein [Candidatus Roizmanbacteria bacterium]|nr:DUF4349 domain-containing protein [Candidatus Roizmanbacteria bacterium]